MTLPVPQNDNQDTGNGTQDGAPALGPYATGAPVYLAAGWSPIPIGVGRRNQPPSGVTGAKGRAVEPADVAAWMTGRGGDNLGIRLPQNVVGIDVDCHDGKLGGEQILVLEAAYGPLPSTWHSTSRTDGSKIMFYRCPPHIAITLKDLAPDIELIRHWYRYAAVWPSVNEKSQAVYRWFRPDGAVVAEGIVPTREQLMPLPPSWHQVKPLQLSGTGEAFAGNGGGDFTDPDVDALLLHGVPVGTNQDPVLRDLVWKLVAAGCSDMQVQLQWLAVVAKTPQLGAEPWTVTDFQRHLRGARAKLGAGEHIPVGWIASLGPVGAPTGEAAGDGGDGVAPVDTGPMPPPATPMPVARRLLPELSQPVSGLPLRLHWRGGWLVWAGDHWQEEGAVTFGNWLYQRLEHATYQKPEKDGNTTDVPWNPVKRTVGEVERAVQALRTVEDTVETGARLIDGVWVNQGPDTAGMACRNGVLDPASRELTASTPARLLIGAMPFDYDPGAECPAWLEFMAQIHPDDPEAVALVQEWFGYVVSGRTNQHKIMFLAGTPRSGKSTTAKILGHLVGPGNVAAPTLSSLSTQFGMSSMIGRPLAVMDDVRTSSKTDIQVVIERLLTISGVGRLDVDRKNLPIWSGQLPTRITIASNNLPWLTDASGAIIHRLLVVDHPVTFLGKEDITLEDRLVQELPGILNWALDGLDRLTANGAFSAVASSQEAVAELHEQANPVKAFLRERCELGDGFQVGVEAMFLDWLLWDGKVSDDRSARTSFGMRLRGAVPGLGRERSTVEGDRSYHYVGIRLRHALPQWAGGVPG